MKVVHITSAHPALDIRIFYKECISLQAFGHEVHLVTLASPQTYYQGIMIHALNSQNKLTRWQRLLQIYQLAKSIPADVYHFHDPEFIPFAWLLKLKKNKVIYDVHEDTVCESLSFNKNKAKFIVAYKYLRWWLLEKLSNIFFDGFVCATPHIAKKFPRKKTVIIRNYVDLQEFTSYSIPFAERSNTAIYVGGIMKTRGLREMINAVQALPPQYTPALKLIGNFSPPALHEEAKQFLGWEKVTMLSWLTRDKLIPHFYTAKVGLVLLHPEKNYREALPIKLFEYMAAGLPVIVSDFPIWREIVLESKCGFVVDPFDQEAVINAMTFIFDHPDEAEKMGNAGRKAVQEYYNWQSEAVRLVDFCETLDRLSAKTHRPQIK